jgi:hypothetical protein
MEDVARSKPNGFFGLPFMVYAHRDQYKTPFRFRVWLQPQQITSICLHKIVNGVEGTEELNVPQQCARQDGGCEITCPVLQENFVTWLEIFAQPYFLRIEPFVVLPLHARRRERCHALAALIYHFCKCQPTNTTISWPDFWKDIGVRLFLGFAKYPSAKRKQVEGIVFDPDLQRILEAESQDFQARFEQGTSINSLLC